MIKVTKKLYVGVVEDNKDPNRKGRIKVRVQSLFNELEVEDIPFASPFMDLAGKEFKVPAIGKLVNVLFLTENMYDPYYIFSENYNINLENKLEKLSEDEYVDFIALLFDERTQISVDSKELTIDHLYNKMTINNETINIELKDNLQKINLGSKGSEQEAVLGTNFFEWMDDFIIQLMSPISLIAGGTPVTKPALDNLMFDYLKLRPTFVSNHVKIVDNNSVKKLERKPETETNKNDKDLTEITFDTDPVLYSNYVKAVDEQNYKSCQLMFDSEPSSNLTQPEVEYHENLVEFIPFVPYEEMKVGDETVYVAEDEEERTDYINDGIPEDKIITEAGSNWWEQTTEAEQQENYVEAPDGEYKGSDYLIETEEDEIVTEERETVYVPTTIESLTIPIPDAIGLFKVYKPNYSLGKGEYIGDKEGIKLKGKIIIKDYYPPLKKMVDAAESEGVNIVLTSAFRSANNQYDLRKKNAPSNKKNDNQWLMTASSKSFNPETSAPGYSTHCYGIAVDIETGGGRNSAYKWLEKNALSFGFIRTVKKEQWHWEYKPWTIRTWLKSNDKYAAVPKGHSTWNEEEEDEC